jgi:hypothetical protein
MLHYIVIKQVDAPVHNCDIGVSLLYKALCFRPIALKFLNVCSEGASLLRDDHVILCSSFKLFEHQTVRSSRVHCIFIKTLYFSFWITTPTPHVRTFRNPSAILARWLAPTLSYSYSVKNTPFKPNSLREIFYIINSIEQSPSGEAGRCSPRHETDLLLWNQALIAHVHKSPPQDLSRRIHSTL